MLILTRRPGETLHIGDNITVTVLGSQGDQVRLGITAPDDVAIHRSEIYQQIGNVRPVPPAELVEAWNREHPAPALIEYRPYRGAEHSAPAPSAGPACRLAERRLSGSKASRRRWRCEPAPRSPDFGAWPIAGRLTHGERPPVQRRAQRRISTCSPAPTADRQHAVEPAPNRFHIRRCM